jgi:SpoVK/Ycf46/Vps4 family AAA+-type ATPase
MLSDQDRFEQLVSARHSCVSIVTSEEGYALSVVGDVALRRQCDYWIWSVTRGVRDGLLADSPPVPDTDHPAAALFHLSRNLKKRALIVAMDVVGHLKDERVVRALRDALTAVMQTGSTLVLLDYRDDLPPLVQAIATRFEISLPDEVEIEELIKQTLRAVNVEQRIAVDVTRQGLDTMIRTLRGLPRRQIRQIIIDSIAEDRRFDDADVKGFLSSKRRAVGDGLLEYVEAPTSLDEIGGLTAFKDWLQMRSDCFSAEAKEFGLPVPRGVLMLGVQGAGKSLSAKAVATAWQRPLLRMDVGALYDRYVGESEKRLRDALRQAERMAPVVLWIDEIEKAFASAASQSTDGGLSKRMFGTLLTWMQEHQHPVFLFATANDIEALPPELLRKGRFDEIFFVDLPNLEARSLIFRIHLAKRRKPVESFDLAALASVSEGFSGAEIEQAIIAALYTAYREKTQLNTDHIIKAIRTSPPLSVTMREKIEWLRDWAKERCVSAE